MSVEMVLLAEVASPGMESGRRKPIESSRNNRRTPTALLFMRPRRQRAGKKSLLAVSRLDRAIWGEYTQYNRRGNGLRMLHERELLPSENSEA